MKKFILILLAFCITPGVLTACGENTALQVPEAEETPDKNFSDDMQRASRGEYIEYVEGVLTIKGDETVEMDDILRKMEKCYKKKDDTYDLEMLTISSEVKHINARTEKTNDIYEWLLDQSYSGYGAFNLDSLRLETTSLSPEDICNLFNTFHVVETICVINGETAAFGYKYIAGVEDLTGEMTKFYRYYFPNISSQDGFYIADGILFGYSGKERDLVIPDSVTAIAPYAVAYDDSGETLTTKLNSVMLSDSVIEIGRGAFCNQPIKKLELGNSVRIIETDAFCVRDIETVRIPESVDIVKEDAFSVFMGESARGNVLKRLQIEGSAKNFDENFCDSDKIVLQFSKGIEEAVTILITRYFEEEVEGKTYRVNLSWLPVDEADGYEIYANVGGYYEDRTTDKYMAKKVVTGKSTETSFKLPAPKKDYEYARVGMSVTPFQYVKGKKVYGRGVRYMAENIYYDNECYYDDWED